MSRTEHRLAGRYGSLTVPFISAGLVVQGALMLALPHRFTSAVFNAQYHLMPRACWAVAFILSGLAALATAHPVSIHGAGAVLTAWTLNLLWSAFFVRGASATAPIWPSTAVLSLHLSLRLRGTGRGR